MCDIVCLSADLHLQFLHCHTRLGKKTSFKRFKLCLDFAPSLSFRTNQEFATNVSMRPLFPPFCSPLRPKPLDSEFHDDVEQCLTEFLAIRSRSFLETAFQPLLPSRIAARTGKGLHAPKLEFSFINNQDFDIFRQSFS